MPACKACGAWFVKIKPHEELCDKCESALYRASGLWIVLGVYCFFGLKKWNKRFSELYDELKREVE